MAILFSCVHGSKLYGTNSDDSDTDIKGVYLCDSLDEYMDKKGDLKVLRFNNKEDGKDKVEGSVFPLQMFADKLSSMETNCVGMLFVPKDKWLVWSDAWLELLDNKDKLISKDMSSFLGQTKSQLHKQKEDPKRLYNAMRTLKEAQQLVTEGFITYPSLDLQLLRDLKFGKYQVDEAMDMFNEEMALTEELINESTLPEHNDSEWIHTWAKKWQFKHWGLC